MEKTSQATLTDKLVRTAENINELKGLIERINIKIIGSDVLKPSCDSGPWPPEFSVQEWTEINRSQTARLINDLKNLLEVI